jgi:chemotaxis regulatin CheY-phosphate phosphatase CheZ
MRKRKKVDYDKLIKNKKLPILTLDARWHELFPDEIKSPRIKELEHKVNRLLKDQGKVVYDIKDMKKLKKSLISDIVVNMDIKNDIIGKSKEKKLDQNKRYINELNEKIDKASDRLSELPYKIKEANEELVLESLKSGYERISDNQDKLDDISEWIQKTREELKQKILEKHDMETDNNLMYSYMHDILGSEVIDAFDLKLNIDKKNSDNP